MIFGFTGRVIWDTINTAESKNNTIEVFHLPIEQFSKGGRKSSPKIYFRFNNNLESIPVEKETIKPYLNANPNDYTIILEVRKGIWNHYVYENWDLMKK